MLNRRQIDVQQQNLISMCRVSVKSLLDYGCLNTNVDEHCEEFVNFCAVFEQMVSHRLRPYQKRVWHRGEGTPRHFWDVLVENHNRTPSFVFDTCIPNVERIESLKSPKAKLRAFLRVALMEKKLSEYLFWVLDCKSLIRQSYLDGALMLSEEATVLVGDLIGLNAIDFNFCLKGNENELLGPLEVNYAPFLRHRQSSASQCIDREEMLRLSGKNDNANASSILSDNSDALRLQNLEKDFRGIREQKDYLEELARLRERQLAEIKMRLETMRTNQDKMESEWSQERQMLDACILELQGSISNLQTQNSQLKHQVSNLQDFKDTLDMKNIPMMDMAYGPYLPIGDEAKNQPTELEQLSAAFVNQSKSTSHDERSIQSLTSDQVPLKEDSQSMVPLTGSLADVNIALLKDQPSGGEKSKATKAGFLSSQEMAEESGEARGEEFVHQNEDSRKEPEIPMAACGITESYVMAEVVGENTSPDNPYDTSSATVEEAGVDNNETIRREEQAQEGSSDGQHASTDPLTSSHSDTANVVDAEVEKAPEVMTTSDESAVSLGTEVREEEVLTSDPEILDRVNTSSEGSDAAWEMLSDSEHADNTH